MSIPLQFKFEDLHPDSPELREDLDWLLRFVASRLEVWVHGSLLFAEVEFPVLELARVLDDWVKHRMPRGESLHYEVTGGEGDTLSIIHGREGWFVESVLRKDSTYSPRPLTEDEVRQGIASYLAELTLCALRSHSVDVSSLIGGPRN
jgi:hypothetical protein